MKNTAGSFVFFLTGNTGLIEKVERSIVCSQMFCRTVGNLSQPLATKTRVENRDSKSGPEATFLLSEEVE